MKQIILGTAGHVDHGKTSLIKALTGVDLDRLKEEKERGITIELGFTSLTLPGGERLGIVDVPGHEKFIKNMVAGVGGIDLVLFIIAADEGIMPQTKEHLDICTLLNVTNGLIAVTKRDLVDREWLQMVQEEIREFTHGTFLENRPVVPVSSATMEGIPDLLSSLDEVVKEMAGRKTGGILRLPIDRVFTMKGFGTVVTGTLVSGEVSVGDTVAVLPPGIKAKVRGIQVHNEKVEKATAGLRTAINLQGVEKALLERGNVMTLPDLLHPTRRIDCHLTHLAHANKPLKNGSRVKFHTGTVECESLITLLDRDELLPGEKSFVQVRFAQPIVVLPNDRFVIRSSSPLTTIGGGEILDPLPPKHKRLSPEVLEALKIIETGNREKMIETYLQESRLSGTSIQDLGARVGVHPKDLSSTVQRMVEEGKIVLYDQDTVKLISRPHFEGLKRVTLKELKSYHESNPLKKGILKEELKSKLPRVVDAKFYNQLITCLSQEGSIRMEKDKVWLSGYVPLLEERQKEMRERIVKIYEQSRLQPPTVKDLVSRLSGKEEEIMNILGLLSGEGILMKVKEDLFFHGQAINRLKDQLVDFLLSKSEIDAPQFKELTQVSRKYAIPLLEHFDSIKLTVRVGDKRVLREKKTRG